VFLNSSLALGQNTTVLDLPQLLQMVEKNNQNYLSQQTNIQVAQHDLASKQSQRIPKLDLIASYLYSPLEDKRLVPRAQLSSVDAINRFSDQIATVGLKASYPLYTGGQISANIEMAEFAVTKSEHIAQQTLHDMLFKVTQIYYRIIAFKQLILATQKSTEQLSESLRIVKQSMSVGKASKVIVLKLESRLANTNQTLIDLNAALKKERASLFSLIYPPSATTKFYNIDVPIVVDSLPEIKIKKLPSHSELLGLALTKKPDFLAILESIKMQREKVKVAKSANLPKLSLEANYQVSESFGEQAANVDDANIGLYFSMSVFDGGVISSNIQKNKSQLVQLKQKKLNQILVIQKQINDALQNVRKAEQSIPNSLTAVAASRESLRIENLKLSVGKGLVNDVLDAQAESLKAEFTAIQAQVNLNTAYAELAWVTGDRSLIND